jgi:hypothetical protein
MASPNPAMAFIGSFHVFVDLWVNGVKTGNWRHVGVLKKLDISTTIESAKLENTTDGARATYAEETVKTEAAVAMEYSEFSPENLALGFGGSVTTWTQASGTATDAAITGTIKKGYGLATGKNRITVTAVKKGAATLVNANGPTGTGDYWVEAESGTIFILDTTTTAGLVDGDAITWSGSWPAITSKPQVNGLTAGLVTVSLKAVSAANQRAGVRKEIFFPKLTVMGDGVISLINSEYASGNLKGTALFDSSQTSGEELFRIRDLV